MDAAIAEGQRINYNFIRPHQALKGKTPSEKAEIDLDLGRNKWLSLIKKGLQCNTTQKSTPI